MPSPLNRSGILRLGDGLGGDRPATSKARPRDCRSSALLLGFRDACQEIGMSLPRSTTYDAIVVGAGPAGSHLSYLLARTGRRVALLDKQRFPRDKVCGGGLSRKSIALLDVDIAPVVHNWITGAFLTFQNRAAVIKDLHFAGVAPSCATTRSNAAHAGVIAGFFLGKRRFSTCMPMTQASRKNQPRRNHGPAAIAADGVASVRTKVFGRRLFLYVPVPEAPVGGADAP
jgi:hypothetical protein